jgi:hypothetical protein
MVVRIGLKVRADHFPRMAGVRASEIALSWRSDFPVSTSIR